MAPASASIKVVVFLVALVTYTLAGNVLASSTQTADAPISETQTTVNTGAQQDASGLLSEIHQAMPNLEQALIIFTSFNGILIVLGAAAYVLRERLNDQSASTLASIKATQSPMHKNNSDPM